MWQESWRALFLNVDFASILWRDHSVRFFRWLSCEGIVLGCRLRDDVLLPSEIRAPDKKMSGISSHHAADFRQGSNGQHRVERVLQKCGFKIIGKNKDFANRRGEDTEEYILRLGSDQANE